MAFLIAFLILACLLAAVVFLFFGNVAIWHLRPIKRLELARTSLGPVPLAKAIPKGEKLQVLGRRLLVDIADISVVAFEYRSLGDAMQIVQFRRHSLRKIINELRLYCALLIVAGIIAFGVMLYKVKFDATILLQRISEEPFQILALFELVMLALFSVRLIIELQIITELLEE